MGSIVQTHCIYLSIVSIYLQNLEDLEIFGSQRHLPSIFV